MLFDWPRITSYRAIIILLEVSINRSTKFKNGCHAICLDVFEQETNEIKENVDAMIKTPEYVILLRLSK